MGNVMVRGHHWHSDHYMIEFSVLGEVMTVVAELLLQTSVEQTLTCFGGWMAESLGKQS